MDKAKRTAARLTILLLLAAAPAFLGGQTPVAPPMQDEHQDAGGHMAGVNERGDHAMGFSHEKSKHHFGLTPEGGFIEVNANDPADSETRDQIRMHLTHISRMFAEGNFELPMLIHATVPPGVPVMKARREAIAYSFEQTPNGGRVRIKTADAEALKAVHEFLAFQIQDHKTGDSSEVTSAK